MGDEGPKDLTLEVLINIRDEIRDLRRDTNARFEAIEAELLEIKEQFKRFVTHFERDNILLASEVDKLKDRVGICENRLGI